MAAVNASTIYNFWDSHTVLENHRFLKNLPSKNRCLSFSIWQQSLTVLISMFSSAFIPFVYMSIKILNIDVFPMRDTVISSATTNFESVEAADTPVVGKMGRLEPQNHSQLSVDLTDVDAVGLSTSEAVSTCTFIYKSKVYSKTKPGCVAGDLLLSNEGDQLVVIVEQLRLDLP
uniref:Uncharacterized protein n=1 Tax=Glossina pallidipes TaxID=7398 RepID=A0A1A9ZW35_GLOPL